MPNPALEGLKRLQELWNSPTPQQKFDAPRYEVFNEDGEQMFVPHPPQFQPYPEVVGSSELARAVKSFIDLAPALQGRIGKVQVGPTADMVRRLDKSNAMVGSSRKWHPEDLSQTGLLGVTNMRTGNVSLNPRLTVNEPNDNHYDIRDVLAHELTHVAGYGDETRPDEAGNILEQLRRSGKW